MSDPLERFDPYSVEKAYHPIMRECPECGKLAVWKGHGRVLCRNCGHILREQSRLRRLWYRIVD